VGRLEAKREKKKGEMVEMIDEVRGMLKGIPKREEREVDVEGGGGNREMVVLVEEEDVLDNWDDESVGSNDNNDDGTTSTTDPLDRRTGTTANTTTHSSLLEHRQPSRIGEQLKDTFSRNQRSSEYQRMARIRASLPIYHYRQKLLDCIRDNPVTILFAETGAGKTTQLPSFILESALLSGYGDETSIICTQPRRISAVSVSERVADERNEPLGGTGNVGYHIRMEARKSRNTKLLF